MAQYLGLRIFKYAHFTLKSPWDKCEMCILEDTKPQILSQFELILAHYPWSFATDWLKMAQYLGLRIFKYAHFTLKSPWVSVKCAYLKIRSPNIEPIWAHFGSLSFIFCYRLAQNGSIFGASYLQVCTFHTEITLGKCEMCILEDTKPQILSKFELILAHYPSSFSTDWLKMAQYLGLRIFKYAHFTLKSPWVSVKCAYLKIRSPKYWANLSSFWLIILHLFLQIFIFC